MKISTLTLICCLFSLGGFAQGILPFPQDSATWRYQVMHHYGLLSPTDAVAIGQISAQGYTWTEVVRPFIGDPEIRGGYREDSLQVIYCPDFSDTTSYVLYDFSLQPGDTFLFRNQDSFPILEREEKFIAGTNRLTITLMNTHIGMEDTWVSGIGSLRTGIMHDFPENYYDSSSFGVGTFETPNLLCFTASGDQHPFEDYPHCDYKLQGPPGIVENEHDLFKVFPNPTSDILTIESDTYLQSIQVAIFSLDGRALRREKRTVQSNQMQVDFTDFAKGYYLLELGDESGSSVIKVFKE